MKYGRSLQELAIELDRQAKVKKDYKKCEACRKACREENEK